LLIIVTFSQLCGLARLDPCLQALLMWRVDRLSEAELEKIRRFLEETDIDELSDEMHALVEKYWPWLLDELPPRVTR
jgi:hypothetical protein